MKMGFLLMGRFVSSGVCFESFCYAQFHGIFRLSAKAKSEVLDQAPNPDQQDQADGKSHKDLIHGFCGREIAEKDGHITAKSAQN